MTIKSSVKKILEKSTGGRKALKIMKEAENRRKILSSNGTKSKKSSSKKTVSSNDFNPTVTIPSPPENTVYDII